MDDLLIAIIVAFAHAVETTTGFGGTVIALALGVHIYPIETLIVSLMCVGCLQAAWILARDWRHVALDLLSMSVLPCAVVGMSVGFFLRTSLQAGSLKAVLGIFVILVATVDLWRLARTLDASPLGRWPGRLVLGVGGVFHGLFASGGPAIVYWAARSIPERRSFRATLAALWLVLNTTLLAAAAATGTLPPGAFRVAVVALPGLLIGIAIGELLHPRISARAFRGTVSALLLFIGVTLLG